MSEFLTVENMMMLVGGLGIFLYGIKLMGESLKDLAGEQLREFINKFTSNKFMGVLVGVLATVAIQSSSGTSALTISLVRAGLMSLTQAIGVIMGANIGTTVTAFLLGLPIKDYALLIIFLGSAIYMFSHKRKKSLYGQMIFGFGMLFYGMVLMETPLKELSQTEAFEATMQTVATNPLLGVLIGAVLTMIVQSSSATIGILQVLFATNAVTFPIAFAILLGDNVGTTITSLLASIGGSRDSQRAALSHVTFNIFGTIFFFLIMFVFGGITLFEELITFITVNILSTNSPELQIAFMHFFFNVTITLILVWFVAQIEMFVRFVIPAGKDEVEVSLEDQFLDHDLVNTAPSMALQQGENAMIEMIRIVKNQLVHLEKYVVSENEGEIVYIEQLEVGVNTIDKKLKGFFREISAASISEHDVIKLNSMMYTINDVERIGDLTLSVGAKIASLSEDRAKLSKQAQIEITKMVKVCLDICNDILEMYVDANNVTAGRIYEKEKHLDKMERKYYKNHLNRVSEKICTGKYMISYVDILGDLERIGDHAQNIAEYYTNENEVLKEEEEEVDLANIIHEVQESER